MTRRRVFFLMLVGINLAAMWVNVAALVWNAWRGNPVVWTTVCISLSAFSATVLGEEFTRAHLAILAEKAHVIDANRRHGEALAAMQELLLAKVRSGDARVGISIGPADDDEEEPRRH